MSNIEPQQIEAANEPRHPDEERTYFADAQGAAEEAAQRELRAVIDPRD
jgi:hypothetical protein